MNTTADMLLTLSEDTTCARLLHSTACGSDVASWATGHAQADALAWVDALAPRCAECGDLESAHTPAELAGCRECLATL